MARGKGSKISAFTDFKVANGYVFYDRLKQGEGHWKNLCHRASTELNGISNLTPKDWKTVASSLYELGVQEQDKELALIKKYLPDFKLNTPVNYQNLIEAINTLIKGKKAYQNMLKVLNNAIDHQKTNQIDKKTGEYKSSKERSPMISSYFMTYFNRHITKRMNEFQKYVTINCLVADSIDWEQAFNKAINDTIDDSIQDLKKVKEKYADDDTIWADIVDFYNSSPIMRSDLYNTIHSQVDFSDLKNLAIQQKQKVGNRGYGKLTKNDVLEKTIVTEKQNRTLGGYIQEVIENLFAGANLTVTLKDTGANVAIKNLENNMSMTDSVMLFSANSEVSLQDTVQNLNDTLLGSKSLEDTRTRLQNFYNNNLANLTDSFLVYVSTKSYALTEGFEKYGFRDGSPKPLSHLPTFLETVGINYGEADLFIKKIYSTIPGGFIEELRTEYLDNLREILVEALAYLMFDDWQQIGQQESGATSIHLFNLDGIYIPLSVLLMSLGSAAESQPKGFFRVSFNTPKSILYPNPITEVSSVEELDTFWNNQNAATSDFKFVVKFLTNFKSLVRKNFDF